VIEYRSSGSDQCGQGRVVGSQPGVWVNRFAEVIASQASDNVGEVIRANNHDVVYRGWGID
jgi:hypothetical protein